MLLTIGLMISGGSKAPEIANLHALDKIHLMGF